MADLKGFKTAGSSRSSRSTASLRSNRFSRSKRFTALRRSKPHGRGMVYLAGTKLNPSRFAPAERFESQQAKKIGP